MADMLFLPGEGPGPRYRDIADPAGLVTWLEPGPAEAPAGGIPYARLGVIGDISPAPYIYTVELEIAEADLPAIFDWYEGEHLPMLCAVPGTRGGARYRRLDGGPFNLLACYRFESPNIPETPAWITARSTPWTERVRPLFRNARRFIRKLEA